MFKKIILITFFLVFFASFSFAGIKFNVGQTTLKDSPSSNSDSKLKSVNHFGLDFDIGIPLVGIDFLLSGKLGQAKQDSEALFITEYSYGFRKEFFALVKPFVGLGASNGSVQFKTASDGEDKQSYNATWISVGVNGSLGVVQIGTEYRYSQKTEVEFSYDNDNLVKRDIASNSSSIYFGFGLGF